MLKHGLFTATALAALAAATPASAQILAPSGPRIELQAGFEGDRADFTAADYQSDGAYLGLGVGYDISLGLVALGIDLEAGESSIEDAVAYQDVDGFVTGTFENERDLYVGGRLTVPVGPLGDVYLKGGYTNVMSIQDLTINSGTETFYELVESDEDGFRVGAGGRFYVGRGAYLGAEYRFARYDSEIEKHQALAVLGLRF
ncbi:outer membrane beta-barrel protein [Sphingomicrobium astaxanthinifaciens]|uniref:outer membrane beta-barrel protein n=1 Tax=Sphingomicrobium astaxanthinifaciens TaxID=1227949 RepID=UPI001FCC4CEC|nr:outer membrane beta-barrel protein [Sphingomicrobium astaxanthinifaciens]MCJ7420287.1 porin family protein [Sphingomicrobium astaxanthinifaciens]